METPLLPKTSEEVDKNSEHYKLGGRPPLVTLLNLLIGPLASQLTNSICWIVDSWWISRTHGSFGQSVAGSVYVFDYLIFACGEFMLIAVSSRISLLFSKNREKEAAKVVIDFIRYSFIFGAIIAAVLLPIVKLLTKWISGSDKIAHEAFLYEIPILGGSFIQLIYLLGTGILEGEGRSLIAGISQVICMCLIMFVFDPLFLVYFKMGVWGASCALVLSQGLVGFTILFLILSGRYSLKFNMKMFIEPFTKQSFRAIKVGFAAFMLNISGALPEFAMQKFLTLTAERFVDEETFLAVYDSFNKFYELGLVFMYSFDASFIPAASYALGKRKYRRIHRLALHTIWITITTCGIYSIIMCLFPSEIVRFWNSNPDYIYWAGQLFPIGYSTFCLWPISSIALAYLESLELPARATWLSIVTSILPLPMVCAIIFYSFKDRTLKLMFSSYIFAEFLQVLFSIPFFLKPFLTVHRMKDGDVMEHQAEQDEEEDEAKESLVSVNNTPGVGTGYTVLE